MYTFTNRYLSIDKNLEFAQAAMMGPNAMRVAEELASHLDIKENMKVLDLGCGCGLSTLLLAQKYGVSVVAADLWISPTENYERFQSAGIDDKAIPISVDATKGLPFANGYFDILFTIGAYQYFGDTAEMLPSLIPFVRKGGYIAVAIPGIKYEFGENIPDEMKPFWHDEVDRTIHSLEWWKNLWETEKGIEIIDISEMACHKQAWDEWLAGYHPGLPFADVIAESIEMMKAENGKYYNTIQLIAKV
ncbi:MAG: methyltransferase domain-containing protein [Peptococcaceae bacterium]|nr:methyltransferase domain-containing protein [Peptococcaceae bacterium]